MSYFHNYIGEQIEVCVSGKIKLSGILVDTGSNIIVIYNGKDFLYIPLVHVQSLNFNNEDGDLVEAPDSEPILSMEEETLSLRKILNNAKGIFSEIFVTSHQSIHGYITNVMNDYFIFFSPVHKTMFVPLQHLKWLIPYNHNHRPYSLDDTDLPLTPSTFPMSRTFEEQCKKHIGKIAIFDMGINPIKTGKLVNIEDGQVELVIAGNQTIFTNLQHIKTVQFP